MAAPITTSAMSTILSLVLLLQISVIPSLYCDESQENEEDSTHIFDEKLDNDFYSYSVKEANGNIVSLDKYRGKVVLVVNVASECGFTDGHYKGLIRLRNVLSMSEKFEVLAFPCNQFGGQEPASDEEIQIFAKTIYHPNFPIFAKINVLHEDVPAAWQYLISKSGIAPNWNFWKYLVDENGHVLTAWSPWVPVEDIFHPIKEVVNKIGEEKPKFLPNGRMHGEL